MSSDSACATSQKIVPSISHTNDRDRDQQQRPTGPSSGLARARDRPHERREALEAPAAAQRDVAAQRRGAAEP